MKRFFLVSMVFVWVGALFLGFCATPAPAQNPIELSITYQYPSGSDKDLHLKRWTKKIEEDSKGRLKFRIYAGAVLVNAFETYSSISKGVADIGFGPRYGVGAPFTDEIIATALLGTPDVATSTLVVNDLMKKYPEQYAKEWGDTKILWLQADPSSNLFTRDKPVRVPEDVKGMEIRAPIKPAVELWKALGAKPVSMSLADFVIGLQKGTVDAGTTTKGDIKSFKFPSVSKYFTDFALFACPTIFMVMNLNKWNALPPDLQKVIEDDSKWGKAETVKFLDEDTVKSQKWAEKEGMEFITLTKEERNKWIAAAEPVYLRLAANLDAKGYPASEAFKFAQERLAHYMK
jgi:TRAP-type C4-dicarboxylate transport system substrate-binding protein